VCVCVCVCDESVGDIIFKDLVWYDVVLGGVNDIGAIMSHVHVSCDGSNRKKSPNL